MWGSAETREAFLGVACGLIVTVVIVLFAELYIFKSCRDVPGEIVDKTQKVIHDAGQQLAAVAAAFNQELSRPLSRATRLH
jgi:hypothetical protein